MENIENDVLQFHHYRRIDGIIEPVDLIRRNRRPEIQFPTDIVEHPLFTDAEQPDEYQELLDEVCQNLNEIERRTWLRIIDGRSILDIAAEENVTRAAIYDRIKRMVQKNSYCAIWWRLKNKTNQHK